MLDAVGNDLDREAFSIADRLTARLAVTHHPRKFSCLGDPSVSVTMTAAIRPMKKHTIPVRASRRAVK